MICVLPQRKDLEVCVQVIDCSLEEEQNGVTDLWFATNVKDLKRSRVSHNLISAFIIGNYSPHGYHITGDLKANLPSSVIVWENVIL